MCENGLSRKFEIAFENHGCSFLQAEEWDDHLARYQCAVQQLASVMVRGLLRAYGMSNMHICEKTINADRHIPSI